MVKICGIGGIISLNKPFGAERLEFVKTVCTNLLLGLEERGRDATGIAHIRSDADNYTHRIYKQPLTATKFVEEQEYKDLFGPDTNVVFLHTRAKTAGDATNNKNNHPHYNKETGNVQVHNGVISMHEFLKNQHELKCDGECDSEVLMRMIEKFGFRKGLSKVSGSAAIAFSHGQSRHISLYCSGNPLVLAYVPQVDLYVFASTMHILNDAMGQRETQTFNGLKMQKFTRFVEYYSMELADETKVLFNMRKSKISVERKIGMDKTAYTGYRGKHYGDNLHIYGNQFDGYDAPLKYAGYDEDEIPVRYVLPKKKEETTIENIHRNTGWDANATIEHSFKLGFTKEEIKAYLDSKFTNSTYGDQLLAEYEEEKALSEQEDKAYLDKDWKESMEDPETFADSAMQMGYNADEIKRYLETQHVNSNTIDKIMTEFVDDELWQEHYAGMDDRGYY